MVIDSTLKKVLTMLFLQDSQLRVLQELFYLADEVINREKGRIFFFTYEEGGTPNIIKKNAGTVDYMHGEVLIDTVNILFNSNYK